MKQILLIIALVSTFSINGIAQNKIGHINSQEILSVLPERVTAEQKVESFAKEKETFIQNLYLEYQSEVQKLQEMPATATQTEKTSQQNLVVKIQERLGAAEQNARQDISALEQELIQPMLNKVQDAINAVAKANGFAYILDTGMGAVVYAEGGEDISGLVKAHLGLQ